MPPSIRSFATGAARAFVLALVVTPLFSTQAECQAVTPQDYQEQLDCRSPRNQALLDAPWQHEARDNVWVLEVLGAMGLNRHCPDLSEALIANYIERQAANDVIGEDIGTPATVRDAIAWERQAEYENTPPDVAHGREQLHRRLLTRAFTAEVWVPEAAAVDVLRERPRIAMRAPGLWVESIAPGMTRVMLSLGFMNRSERAIEWDVHTLHARANTDGPYDLYFGCMRNGQNGMPFKVNLVTVPPGRRVNVVCTFADTGAQAELLDGAWMARLLHEPAQWYVDGPPSDGGTYDYLKTSSRYASPASHATAAPYLESLTCNQSGACIGAKVALMQSPLFLWTRDGGAAALIASALVRLLAIGRRTHIAVAARRVRTVVIVTFAAAFALLFAYGNTLGMGAVALGVFAFRVGVGAVLGTLVMSWFATRRAAP